MCALSPKLPGKRCSNMQRTILLTFYSESILTSVSLGPISDSSGVVTTIWLRLNSDSCMAYEQSYSTQLFVVHCHWLLALNSNLLTQQRRLSIDDWASEIGVGEALWIILYAHLLLVKMYFNPRPDGPLDFPRPDGGGLLRTPPCNSAPRSRSEKPKSAFESSSKIITKVFRSIFR